eukprot:4617682-Amphidinium_carterae.1
MSSVWQPCEHNIGLWSVSRGIEAHLRAGWSLLGQLLYDRILVGRTGQGHEQTSGKIARYLLHVN